MKRLLIILIIPSFCFSQDLNQIKTRNQVEKFITENFKYHNEYKYDSFTIDSTESSFDKFKEGDFNDDGIKDILVFGTAYLTIEKMTFKRNEMIILIGNKNRPKKVNFPYGFFDQFGSQTTPYPKLIHIGQKDFILIGYEVENYRQKTSKIFYDTVSITNDHFIPFTKHPTEKEIIRIDFKTDHCYGTCPVFEMTIDKNLDVDYNGVDHVDKKGQFKLKAEKKDWDYLTSLISNLKIEGLQDNYAVNWTDHQTGFLTVVFR